MTCVFECIVHLAGLRIKETKEVYEGEVTELTPAETENPMGGRMSSPNRVGHICQRSK